MVVKKYGNRRLYDTSDSRYITLEELATKVRAGNDVQVVDAKSGKDLTQATLMQIVVENRGAAKMLPVPLLTQLVRMGDDALGEFFGRYMTAALEIYLQTKQGAQSLTSFNPFSMPFGAGEAFGRLLQGMPWPTRSAGGAAAQQSPPPPSPSAPPPSAPPPSDPVADLRRELEELKQSLRGKRKR
ncbi:MAG TPA: polyhydroxyalkanoate synthesis regulator DNA-binding domain-containing protein [Myxococcales bacterium]|jgi:polyhydroxyalkanoate synthesis repressor PhaR